MRRLLLLSGVLAASAFAARAQAQNLTCGMHCGTGTYTSCNDDATLVGGATAVSCAASQGSCTGETFCATLGSNLPATAFPVDIEELIMVAAGASSMSVAMPFDLSVYEESGTAAPGPQIGRTYNLSIPGSQSAAVRVDLTSGGFSPIRVTTPGAFRVCLRKQFDAGHNVCLDTSGSTPGRNWAFVGIAANPANPCGSIVIPPAWYAAGQRPFPGITGDFILRATVRPSQLAGVPGYSDCGGQGDAGVPDATVDAGAPADAGPTDLPPADTGAPVDTGVADVGPPEAGVDAGAPEDAAVVDASAGEDAAAPDAAEDAGEIADASTPPPTDAGAADAGPIAPPEISALTPRAGRLGVATPLTVTGRGFAAGLNARLGQIPLVDVEVSGSTTFKATVPAGVAAGTYDLLVTNPDGQAAILVEAFTVGGSAGPEPVAADGCRCARRPGGGLAFGMPLGLLLAGLVLVGRQVRRRG